MRHRISIQPGDTIEVVLAETLPNGYVDEVGWVDLHWQKEDDPSTVPRLRDRELQVSFRASYGRVGPLITRTQ